MGSEASKGSNSNASLTRSSDGRSGCPDGRLHSELTQCTVRDYEVRAIRLYAAKLPIDGVGAFVGIGLSIGWGLALKTVWWLFPEHHGLVFELVAPAGQVWHAAVDHTMQGQRVGYYDNQHDARVALFQGYQERQIVPQLAPGDEGSMLAERVIPERERPSFRRLLSTRDLTSTYNVAFNNCQHWTDRVWTHMGGTIGWTGRY